jgi:hypothetical protein
MNNINTIKMVRGIRDKQYEETKGKTKEEIKQYFKKNSEWAFTEEKKRQYQKT